MLENQGHESIASLPFDGDSTDAELEVIFGKLVDAEIIWVNSQSGHQEHVVMKQFLRVVRRPEDRDYIEVLTNQGYRQMYLKQIVSVG